MVPTFTVIRSTGEAPGFAPAVSSWLRRRPSPRPARPDTYHRSDSSPPHGHLADDHEKWVRTAHQPRSTGFELVDDEEASRHRFLAYTFPSCSPSTARPVVPDRPDFVAAAPIHPWRSPRTDCRQLHRAAATAKRCRSLTSIRNNSASWRTTCSSTPSAFTPVSRPVTAIRRAASVLMASQAVWQETPSWWARAETEVSKTLQAVGRPCDGPGSEFRPGPGQLMLFSECGSRAARVRASPDTLGPQQPHRPAKTRDVRSRTRRRPCPTATTPQSGQPLIVSLVSTCRTGRSRSP